MPLLLRRTIYGAFVLCFLVIAPLLAVYSMGYRYHWEKRRFEQTGLIAIDGEPSDATVRVDGAMRSRSLPSHIGGLAENEYTVRIERAGFHPWEQRRRVVSGQTTFIRNVQLFRDAAPMLELSGTVPHLAVSADGQWAAFVRSTPSFAELWFLDLDDGHRTIALRRASSSPTPFAFQWSPRRALLLVIMGNEILILDPNAPPQTPTSLHEPLPAAAPRVQWELGSTDAIIAESGGRLHRISRASGRAVPLALPPPTNPYGVARQHLFTVDVSGDVIRIPLRGGPPTRTVDLPEDVRITAFTDLRGTILTATTAVPERQIEIATADGTYVERRGFGFARMPEDDHSLLWRTSDHELWAEWGDPPTARLLSRWTEPITGARWHPESPYVFLTTAHGVAAVELEASTPRRTITLAPFDATNGLAVTTDGAALFVIGTRGPEHGLWRLPLE